MRNAQKDLELFMKEKFWPKVTKTETCWIWNCSKNSNGYGNVCYKGKTSYTHRLSYEFNNNCVIPKGLCVLHKCDNPSCVNPEHLFLGTPKENSIDCRNKGRTGAYPHPEKVPYGSKHGRAKLTENDVKEIKNMINDGQKSIDISRKYNVDPSTVGLIKRGVNWKHVS